MDVVYSLIFLFFILKKKKRVLPPPPLNLCRFWMGHMQCVSKSAESEAFVAQSGSCRLDELCAEPPRTPAINSDLLPEKLDNGIRVKERRLEPNRVDSSEEAQRLQNAMAHLHESGK